MQAISVHTLASRGLEEPAHPSRGLEELFFQLCCCISFWLWREIGIGFTYYLCTQGIVPYSCGFVLVFLVLAGNSFCRYVCTQCTIQLCGCVSFLVMAGNVITTGKKSSSHLSGGCAIVITAGKKSSRRDFYAKSSVSNLNVTNLYQFQLKLI